jgi:(1->4)-alpha-D-glucan 1-alpha-D-glucosylmutase
MIKAVREAKVHTAWLKPDLAYEEAFLSFIEEILKPVEANAFLNEFVPFARKIAYYGMLNSLSQVLLKILSPGVPDFYQGTELWDLNFVDPDNRRPVDFRQRAEGLQELKRREREDPAALIRELLSGWQDGRIKLYTIYKALNFRRSHKELFQRGAYLPLNASGKARENVCAFARRNGHTWALGAAPRLITRLVAPESLPLGREVWGESALGLPPDAPRRWLNVFTGEELEIRALGKRSELPLENLFRRFPVALLTASETP